MNSLKVALDQLLEECNEFGIGSEIFELTEVPSKLDFAREFYAKNTPVIIRNAVKYWPAYRKWNPDYIKYMLKDKIVDVSVTPNGYADGIAKQNNQEYFTLPFEEQLTITDFLNKVDDPNGPIYYIQKQNSNFTEFFQELCVDIDMSILQFAEASFNKDPDAINFWMGDERAITSMHKDPYENLYAVLYGHKDFILIPPHFRAILPVKKYPTGEFTRTENGQFVIDSVMNYDVNGVSKPEYIDWVCIDPLAPDYDKYPLYAKIKPLHVRVNAGDLLYLPSLWYHHVKQSHKCIALNFWYDMDYDTRYCYFRLLEQLAKIVRR